NGCVQRGCFSATCWARDQHHAIWFFDITAESAEIVFVETYNVQDELVKLLAHRLFVEYAQYRIFTMNRWHDGNAEIDGALRLSVLHTETSVLRHAALGDVELAHNFNARNNSRMMLAGNRWHGLREHAVNAELDGSRVVASFDMNVAGSALKRRKYRRIY